MKREEMPGTKEMMEMLGEVLCPSSTGAASLALTESDNWNHQTQRQVQSFPELRGHK